ncbi:MAG: AMP-binding enzyme, partial [Coraliomargarita sp.]
GTSETGAIRIQSTNTDSLFFRIKDRDTEWKVNEGELWLKTPSRILGYLNADGSALEAGGWYRTGDLVEQSNDGSLRITGRASDLINVGGEKVTPGEVETAVLQLPEIEACTAIGEPNAITGQSVAVKIVTSPDTDRTELKRRIKKHCRSTLSAYKVPTKIYFNEQIELSARHKKQN